ERRRSELLLAKAEAETKAGEKPVANETLLEAVTSARTAGAGEVIARAALLYAGNTEWSTAIFEEEEHPQIVFLEEALNVVPQGEDVLRVMVLARLALALYWTNSPRLRERSERISGEALEVARRTEDPAALAAALEARYYALWRSGNVEDRIVDGHEALRLARESGDKEQEMRLRRLLIFDQLQLGDMAAAEREMQAHASLAEEVRQPTYGAWTTMFEATRALMQGRFEEGTRSAQRGFEIRQAEGMQMAGPWLGAQMTPVWRVDGSLSEVAPFQREQAERFRIPAARAFVAVCLCDLGHVEDARVVFEELAVDDFRGIPQDPAWLQSLTIISEVCAALGDRSRAKTLYDLLLPYATRNVVMGPPALCYLGPAARHLGQLARTLGNTREAIAHFEAALQMTTAMGARPFTVLTQCDYASALLTVGQRDRAMALLDEALATAEELGMKAIVERIHSLNKRASQPVLFKMGGTPFIGRQAELERLGR
ncbi:MAG: tetratricopeptide repeat protein, partial [Gammaproteobacteria bacterium]